MPETLGTLPDAARPRFRGIITAILLLMISLLVVRDIVARRWNLAPRPASDTTQGWR